MTCRDAERLIDTFFDGELDGRLMREAALHVTRCRRCEAEIQDRERLHDALASTVRAEVADIDVAAIWKGIEPVIDRERRGAKVLSWRLAAASARIGGALFGDREGASRGDLDDGRLDAGRAWLGPRVMGLAALAASIVVAVSLATRDGSAPVATVAGDRAQSASLSPGGAAQVAAAPPAVRVAGARPGASLEVQPVAVTRGRRRGEQVQIESVDSRAGAMAMWSVPASDTAVIWLGDSDPRLRRPR